MQVVEFKDKGGNIVDYKWFSEAKFGMFIHWGLYSVLAGEYNGQRCDWTEEWIMPRFRIPIKEYEKITYAFNPIYFNAEEWVRLAKDAGMKYIVFTTKHHEGFAMYHSKVDKYNLIDATPFKRDVTLELSEACRKYGIKFGIYYSQELDWHEEHGGGYSIDKDKWEGKPWSNNWDFPDKSKKDYSICLEKKIKPQLIELLTNYGNIDLIWFDCPTDINIDQSRELVQLVKKYQPNCLINSRIGNGLGDYGTSEDNDLSLTDKNKMMYEVPGTLNDTWGYKSFDRNWKSAKNVLDNLKYLNDRNTNYLLNVGPDGLGRIPVDCAEILREVGKKIIK